MFDEIDIFVCYVFGEKFFEGSIQVQGGNINEFVYCSFYELMGLMYIIDQWWYFLGVGVDDVGNVYIFGVFGYILGGILIYFRSGYVEFLSMMLIVKLECGVFFVFDGGMMLLLINNLSFNVNNFVVLINVNVVFVIGIGVMFLFGLLGRRKRIV